MTMKQSLRGVGQRVEQNLQPRSDLHVLLIVALMLVASCIGVAYSTFHTRVYMAQLQQLESQRDLLEIEWSQLLLEEHAWGSYERVGTVATESLQMVTPTPASVVMVRP